MKCHPEIVSDQSGLTISYPDESITILPQHIEWVKKVINQIDQLSDPLPPGHVMGTTVFLYDDASLEQWISSDRMSAADA